jgi:hypothetical protein
VPVKPDIDPTDMSQTVTHTADRGLSWDELRAVCTELGPVPSGTFTTVKARLDATQTLIAEATPTSGTTVTFTSIPATFQHLQVVIRCLHNNGSAGGAFRGLVARFNNDSGTNYDLVRTRIDDTTEVHESADNSAQMEFGFIAQATGGFVIDIPGYSSASGAKLLLSHGLARNGAAAANMRRVSTVATWSGTAAITELNFVLQSGGGDVFASPSRFSLYGLP